MAKISVKIKSEKLNDTITIVSDSINDLMCEFIERTKLEWWWIEEITVI